VPQKFKKTYLEAKYSLDEYEKKFEEWQDLLQKLFVKKITTSSGAGVDPSLTLRMTSTI